MTLLKKGNFTAEFAENAEIYNEELSVLPLRGTRQRALR
jgi:hypothetical protein